MAAVEVLGRFGDYLDRHNCFISGGIHKTEIGQIFLKFAAVL